MSGPAARADAPADDVRVPLSRVRRATARAMTASAAVPQFTVERPARVAPLLALRREIKDAGGAATVSDMLTAACAHALAGHPDVNASFDDGALVRRAAINVGAAIALADGLIVACVHDADARSLEQLAAERTRLDRAAHAGTLAPREVLDTTFTISNLGPLGVRRFRALVTPPQAAILAVGAIAPQAVADGVEDVVELALSCDHRALDGAPAARFLADVVERLEQPRWMAAL